MSTTDFTHLPGDTVAVLPVAAIEQHGPHLPVYVDACINHGVLQHALAKIPDTLPVTVLPPQMIGKSNEHLAFPGTLSFSVDTLTRMWIEIGESVLRAGIKKMLIFNSHGGQFQVMDIVARELRVRHGMFVVTANSFSFGSPAGLIEPAEMRHGIHGGDKETSMMLALRPDLVRMEHADNFVPLSVAMARDYQYLQPEGKVGFGWQTQDMHPSGACGNAAIATREKGEALVRHASDGLARLLAEVHDFPLSTLKVHA
jgi:creatinine amidohydrolase